MTREFELVLLPGLGCDGRLFEPQRPAFPDLIVPPWITPEVNETLPHYAERLASTIVPTGRGPLILGGMSLGGMMAYEVARHLRPRAVVQIATCRDRRGLRQLWRASVPLLDWLPVGTWSIAKMLAPPVVTVAGCFGARDRKLAVTMFQEMDSAFMHWALAALLRWDPLPLPDIPVFQIHGRRDFLIPANCVEADVYIPDGGHMINITHAEQVNAFLADAVAKVRTM